MNQYLGIPRRGRYGPRPTMPRAPEPTPQPEPEDAETGPIEITPLDLSGLGIAAAANPAAPTAPPPGEAYANLLDQIAPIAKSVLTSSPEEDVQVLKAQIRNHEKLRDTLPEPFKTIYANKVRVLKARLRAAETARSEDKKTQTSRWEWASLGKTSVVIGILAGSALTALLITSAVKSGRSRA